MSYPAVVFRVMIATPNDVQVERDIIREVIHDWNAQNSKRERAVLLPVGWETNSVPTIGKRPQEALNEQMVRDCDLLVAVFWTRLGTDTGKAKSGTVEEINEHVDAGKPAMLYFSKANVPYDVDHDQFTAVKNFKDSYKGKCLFHEYGSHEKFREIFTRQFAMTVQETLLPNIPASEMIEERLAVGTSISKDARHMLLTATGDDNGRITFDHGTDATHIQAGIQYIYRGSERKEIARWDSATKELLRAGLVEECRGYEGLFEVTQKGYQLVDQLK